MPLSLWGSGASSSIVCAQDLQLPIQESSGKNAPKFAARTIHGPCREKSRITTETLSKMAVDDATARYAGNPIPNSATTA